MAKKKVKTEEVAAPVNDWQSLVDAKIADARSRFLHLLGTISLTTVEETGAIVKMLQRELAENIISLHNIRQTNNATREISMILAEYGGVALYFATRDMTEEEKATNNNEAGVLVIDAFYRIGIHVLPHDVKIQIDINVNGVPQLPLAAYQMKDNQVGFVT